MNCENLNVLFIGIDTLRSDHLRCYGYPRRTSPNIDKLADEGVLFTNFFAPGIPTDPGWTTLLTGVHPITHRIVCHFGEEELRKDILFLQETLKRRGYVTVAVDNLRRWFRRGFDVYMFPGAVEAPSLGLKVRADNVNEKAVEWLRKWSERGRKREKFFLFLHYWDPHTPYFPPPPYDRMYYQGDKSNPKNPSMKKVKEISPIYFLLKNWLEGITDTEYVVAQYDGEISYADSKVGEVLDFIEEVGLTEETLIILTSDHGEFMTEHDIYFDHHGLYDPNIRVPLIIKCPEKIPSGKRIDTFVQHIDLPPTILDILGIPEAGKNMEGASLLSILSGEEAGYSEIYTFENTWQCKRAIRTGEWKLIETLKPDLYGKPAGWLELYDLKHDPRETINIAKSEGDIVKELKERLEKWLKAHLKGKPDPLITQETSLRKRLGLP